MRRLDKWLQIVLAALMGTTFFYGEGCASTVARNINPCGTIANCDPLEYDQLFVDYTRSDWNLDPTCSVPGYCGGTPFPPDTGGVIAGPDHDSGIGSATGVTTTGG